MPHRCALGCKNTDVIMHVFPNPVKFPERFQAWVDLVGEKPEIPSDVEYVKKKRICNIHFIPEHRNRNKRLNALAIPLLNLPGLPKSQESENSADNQPGTSFAAAVITSGKQGPKDLSTTQPTNIEVSNDTTRVENVGKQLSKDHYTTEPTVAENSNDSFTGVEYIEQTEISDVSTEAAPSAPMQFCICCLQRGVPLVNLLTCAHVDFLNILMVPQIQAEDRVVCYTCHQMLKKIKKFKRQVQESFKLLSENSIEKSLKKYSNYKRHLTVHETLNLEISEANENSKTTDNIEKALTPTSSHKDRNFEIPETNENCTTTDNTKKVKSKSSHKHKKAKNKKEALKNINGNQNNEYFDLLSTSLKSLSQSLIGDIYTDFQSLNTTELTSRPNDTAVEDIIDKLTDGKEEEEYIILEVGEYQNIETDASDASPTHKRVSPNIKQLTLSKRSLLRERAMLMSSPSYVRALHRCRSCVVAFTFRDNLTDHVSRKHTAPPDRESFMKCRVCRQFVRRDAYNVHRSSHYNRYQCLTCGQIFSSYDDAALHDKIQHLRM